MTAVGRTSVPSEVGEEELQDTHQDTSIPDQVSQAQWDSRRKRYTVLTGSALLQLPIWGQWNSNR